MPLEETHHKQPNKQTNIAILKNAKYYKNNEYWSFLLNSVKYFQTNTYKM